MSAPQILSEKPFIQVERAGMARPMDSNQHQIKDMSAHVVNCDATATIAGSQIIVCVDVFERFKTTETAKRDNSIQVVGQRACGKMYKIS
jgi:hypothetical protein